MRPTKTSPLGRLGNVLHDCSLRTENAPHFYLYLNTEKKCFEASRTKKTPFHQISTLFNDNIYATLQQGVLSSTTNDINKSMEHLRRLAQLQLQKSEALEKGAPAIICVNRASQIALFLLHHITYRICQVVFFWKNASFAKDIAQSACRSLRAKTSSLAPAMHFNRNIAVIWDIYWCIRKTSAEHQLTAPLGEMGDEYTLFCKAPSLDNLP